MSTLPESKPGKKNGSRPHRHTLFALGGRLSLCAEMVRPMSALADVGTDHAYLPIWLALQNRISRAVATDIRPGPLDRARRNIERYHVSDRVNVRLTDGLDGVLSEEADDVVIAGMGGKMIVHILSRAEWLKADPKRLILQPMTSVEDLRVYLSETGYSVLRERAVEEDGHVYTVMLAAYHPGEHREDDLFPYIGKIDASTPENRLYLAKQLHRLSNREAGMRASGKPREAARDRVRMEKIEALLRSK